MSQLSGCAVYARLLDVFGAFDGLEEVSLDRKLREEGEVRRVHEPAPEDLSVEKGEEGAYK